jgi:hypothetical protein
MTVQELIDALADVPDDWQVMVWDDGDLMFVEEVDITIDPDNKEIHLNTGAR